MSQPTELGSELLRDSCPKSYYSKRVVISSMLPGMLAFLLVAVCAGFLLSQAMEMDNVIFFLGLFFVVMTLMLYSLFNGMCKRLSQTYICVCEQGIHGVMCLGQKNQSFCVRYEDVTAVTTAKDRIVITVTKGIANLLVHNPEELADLIKTKAGLE